MLTGFVCEGLLELCGMPPSALSSPSPPIQLFIGSASGGILFNNAVLFHCRMLYYLALSQNYAHHVKRTLEASISDYVRCTVVASGEGGEVSDCDVHIR